MPLKRQLQIGQFANISNERLIKSNGAGLINSDVSVLQRLNGGLGINTEALTGKQNQCIKVNNAENAFEIVAVFPVNLSNSSSPVSVFSNPSDVNKYIARLQYNFDGTWNGGLTETNIFNDVPPNSTILIDWSFMGVQQNTSKGASSFNYSGKTQFRQVAAGTLTKVGSTDYSLITNDTGDTFATVPDLISGGAIVTIRRELTTTKTFETYFTAEVKIIK